jgi:hypothetical protein
VYSQKIFADMSMIDHSKDVPTLLTSTPKGIITLTDATGICCFNATSPQASKKSTMFVRNICPYQI